MAANDVIRNWVLEKELIFIIINMKQERDKKTIKKQHKRRNNSQ